MHPKAKIQEDVKVAMKARDTQRREILRQLMAAFKQVEVDRQTELSEGDVLGVLQSEAKVRREVIAEMGAAGRDDLVANAEYELGVIESYLPRQLAREEIEAIVREVVAEVGAQTPKDMGAVMKVLMPRVKGQADGKLVNAVVREVLS